MERNILGNKKTHTAGNGPKVEEEPDPDQTMPDGTDLPPNWSVHTGYDGRTFYYHDLSFSSTYDLPDANTPLKSAMDHVEPQNSGPSNYHSRMTSMAYQRPVLMHGGKWWKKEAWNSTPQGLASGFLFIFAAVMYPFCLGGIMLLGKIPELKDRTRESEWKAQHQAILDEDLATFDPSKIPKMFSTS